MSEADDNKAELLDDDVITTDFPPERPMGVDERLTPTEEQVDEPLAERVKRENPDVLPPTPGDEVDTLVAPGGDAGLDEEKQALADEVRDDDATRLDVTQEKEGAQPAEEGAMHLTDAPPMGDGDGYVEKD